MGAEKNGNDRKGSENGEMKNKRKRRKVVVSRVQKLYKTCKLVFANCRPGVVPSMENVERVKAVLGMLLFWFLFLYDLILQLLHAVIFSSLFCHNLYNFYFIGSMCV